MNEPIPFRNASQIEDETYDWIVRMDRGLSETEHEALRAWLGKDPKHKAALLEIAKFWDQLDVLAELSELVPLPERKVSRQRQRRFAIAFASAAAIVLSVGMYFAVLGGGETNGSGEPVIAQRAVYETAVGEHSSVHLADGSIMTLNTDTSVDVTYSQNERNIFLARGEAHFVVERDTQRPFNVFVGSRLIQAVGTAFNVELDHDDVIEVVVSEGSVRVRLGSGRAESQVAVSGRALDQVVETDEELILSAGEAVRVGTEFGSVFGLEPRDIDTRFAWQNGMLIFQGESLEGVLDEVSRYTTMKFVVADESLKTLRVGGYFQAGDVDGLLLVLRENFQITSQRVSDDQIVLTAL